MKLSATVITLNEEKNIERCLKSLDFAHEIIVVDSGSTDQTVEIAKRMGAKVFINKFIGYGQQKNFAATQATHPWIFSIDADEEVDLILKESIKQVLIRSDLSQSSSYQITRRTNYCGQWIYHGGWYPDHLIRLYQKDKASFSEPQVHEEVINRDGSDSPLLPGHLNHYSFPTVESQVSINIKYAKLGAKALLQKRHGVRPSALAMLLRPIGKFIECYLIKRGFLDGMLGLVIAINAAHSMFCKYSMARYDLWSSKHD